MNTTKNIRTNFLVAILIMVYGIVNGQDLDNDTIIWKAGIMRETLHATFTNNPGSIVTFRMNMAQIKDNTGTVLKSYVLTNPVGDLKYADRTGKVRYNARASDGESGIFVIDKREKVTRISISFPVSGTIPKEFHYEVISINTL